MEIIKLQIASRLSFLHHIYSQNICRILAYKVTVEPVYNDIGLYDISPIARYQSIRHC